MNVRATPSATRAVSCYAMDTNAQHGSAGRPPRRKPQPGRQPARQTDRRRGPGRPGEQARTGNAETARTAETTQGTGAEGPARGAPLIPPTVEAKQLAPEVRSELTTLDRATADTIARHLVAAGELLDEDPEAALAHAQAARSRSGRIAAIREAVGIAAYHCGDWAQALSELRAARRMGSKSQLLPLIADCERGVGRPERAIELARGPEAAELTGDDADEMRIVAAGARADLGHLDQALAVLSSPPPDPSRTGTTPARLCYAYAEILLALGRAEDAVQWFLRAAAADIDGATDAEERAGELA